MYVIQPDWSAPLPLATAPNISITRIRPLSDAAFLPTVSCLQMTDTDLFINWDRWKAFMPAIANQEAEYNVHMGMAKQASAYFGYLITRRLIAMQLITRNQSTYYLAWSTSILVAVRTFPLTLLFRHT